MKKNEYNNDALLWLSKDINIRMLCRNSFLLSRKAINKTININGGYDINPTLILDETKKKIRYQQIITKDVSNKGTCPA